MSTRRRVSTFTPPVIALSETNGKAASEHPSASFVLPPVKRRFSQDEDVVPVKDNTTAEDLDVVSVLSNGNFADVILVRRRDADRVMVAKAFGHGSWRSEYLCSAELRILQNVNSPWTIAFLGYIQDFEEDFLLLEYLPNGNLLRVVKNKAERLSENQTKFYAAEMFLAVNALHEEGFMHRNVQLSNFLVHTSGHLRICDFGLSHQFILTDAPKKKAKPQLITSPVYASPDTGASLSRWGSIEVQSECSTAYLAPEVLRLLLPKPFFSLLRPKVGYSFLCDYWSLGVAIYHMLYGYLPFRPDSKGCILDKVLAYRKHLSFSPEDGPPPGTVSVDIVRALLTKERKRLGNSRGFMEVKNHPFFEYMAWDRLGHGKVSLPVKEADVARYTTFASSSTTPGTSKGKRMTKQKAAPSLAIPTPDDSRASSSDGEYLQQLELFDVDFHIPVSQDHSAQVGGWSIVDNPSSSVFVHDTVSIPNAVFARSSQPRQRSLSLLHRNSHKCSVQDSRTECVTKVVNLFEESSVDLSLQQPVGVQDMQN